MQISFDLINLMATGGGISTRICAFPFPDLILCPRQSGGWHIYFCIHIEPTCTACHAPFHYPGVVVIGSPNCCLFIYKQAARKTPAL